MALITLGVAARNSGLKCALRIAIGVLCTLTLCGILVVGLWPFHSPRNHVHWLEAQSGIRIDRHGTVVSSGHFQTATSDGPSCSLEMWLQPLSTWDKGTVLAFYNPVSGRRFSLQQHYTDLILGRDDEDEHRQSHFDIEEVFRRKQVLITVTSDGQDTAVYLDDNLIKRSSRFGLSLKDLAGILIVGTSPVQGYSWAGELRGLAIYKSKLTADQVARHYQDWMQTEKSTVTADDSTLALYSFDECAGEIIHNKVRSGTNLYIPGRYLVVDQAFLETPWKEFRRKGVHLNDIFINITGFVPLGFLLCAYFTSVRQVKHGVWAVIVLGAVVSLTIEVFQAYLPTRDSGLTDVITNSLGTAVGAGLYRIAVSPMVRALVLKKRSSYFDIFSTASRR